MWIAPVQVAAPAGPGAAPAAAPPGQAPAFDAALDASLVENPAAFVADGKNTATRHGAVVPQVFDKSALAAWLLGVTSATAQPASVDAAPAEENVDGEPDSIVEVKDDETELPMDMLFVAPVVPQQQPLAVETVEVPAAEEQSADGIRQTPDGIAIQDGAGAQDATPAQYAMPAAAESAKAPSTQAIPVRKATAAEPHKPFRLEPEALLTPDATSKPDMSENRDATLRTESSAPQDRSAGVSAHGATKTVAGARFVGGAQAPVVAVAVGAEPVVTESADVTGAAETAPLGQPPVQGSGRDSRDVAAAMPRFSVGGPTIAGVETQMGGGDAQNFEQDRRSPAAQRLAAALSSMAPGAAAHDAASGAAPAPVFTIPHATAPAPVAAPVEVAPPAPMTHADAENVHNLVQAMRVTAKAGGWEATVRLKPEHLGEVTIALRVEGNNVSAVVQAESAGVRQWLMDQEQAVRSGLSEHGLHLDRFAVSRDGQRREAGEQQRQPQQRRRAPRQAANSNEARFEIVV
jgi:flagellar hook-length control protein FliK